MNDNAKKWVDALRSGEFKQTKGCLQDADGYCCLGVACDLYSKVHNISWASGLLDRKNFLDASQYLPSVVVAWLGLKDFSGSVFNRKEDGSVECKVCLLDLNDRKNFTFEEIAKVIEETPELFKE